MLTKSLKHDRFVTAKMPDTELRRYEDSVLNALEDSRWDYRTAEGISKQTGICIDVVKEILAASDLVRTLVSPDEYGRTLYALRSRPREFREIVSAARNILTGSTD